MSINHIIIQGIERVSEDSIDAELSDIKASLPEIVDKLMSDDVRKLLEEASLPTITEYLEEELYDTQSVDTDYVVVTAGNMYSDVYDVQSAIAQAINRYQEMLVEENLYRAVCVLGGIEDPQCRAQSLSDLVAQRTKPLQLQLDALRAELTALKSPTTGLPSV